MNDFGKLNERNAAFVAFYTKNIELHVDHKLYGETVTLLGMNMRLDGTQGFPGGMVDEGETLRQAAVREIKEEINTYVSEDDLVPVVTLAYSEDLNTHLFSCEISQELMNNIKHNYLLSTHGACESSAFITHHVTPGSFETLLRSQLAPTVRDELNSLRNILITYDLDTMTEQEVFEASASHLLVQSARSRDASSCRYNFNGLKCAAGIFLDSEVDENSLIKNGLTTWASIVGFGHASETHTGLVTSLQRLHDNIDVNIWLDDLRRLGVRESLNISFLDGWKFSTETNRYLKV
jgi:hypothetical protein